MTREEILELVGTLSRLYRNHQYKEGEKTEIYQALIPLRLDVASILQGIRGRWTNNAPPAQGIIAVAEAIAASSKPAGKHDPVMDWEEIREKWLFRLKDLFSSEDVSERELFPLIEQEWGKRYPGREIPSSAYYGVTHKVTEKARAPRWSDMVGYHQWIQGNR
jgi:hypothetical protein